MARDAVIYLTLDEIVIPEGRRPVHADSVRTLAQSIEKIGLQTPITCRKTGGIGFDLVAGRHRLEAFRILKRESIPAVIVKVTDREARRWEIAENLHRADLTELERKEQIAEWVALAEEDRREVEKVSGQLAQKPQGGRPEGGISAAARELNVERTEARRAVQINAITPAAKEAVRDAGLDDNQSALLKVARAAPDRQVAVVTEIAEAKATKLDTDIKNRAAEEMAEAIVEHMPHALHGMMKENAWVCAKPLAIALTNLLGGAIMDKGAA